MRYITAYASDVGIKKETNQDAILIKKRKQIKEKYSLLSFATGWADWKKEK